MKNLEFIKQDLRVVSLKHLRDQLGHNDWSTLVPVYVTRLVDYNNEGDKPGGRDPFTSSPACCRPETMRVRIVLKSSRSARNGPPGNC
jgi:hypothetical protein